MSRKIFPVLGDDSYNNPGPSTSAGFSGKPEWTSRSSTSRDPNYSVVKNCMPVMDSSNRKRYLHCGDTSASTTTDGRPFWTMSLRGIKRKSQSDEFECEAGAKLSRMVEVVLEPSAPEGRPCIKRN